ncbi:BTB POZ domain-containing [Acanthamoeba polyphaga mimivirus]|uniref:BTB POZ domain-containing n=2 Tax=Megamimivirinae TaxID=3044648 RepID=A0A2L2DI30_MIMIV|nr:putative BTB/POZ domain-containing protein [Megavirus lba]AVG45821.1 BTB POZ domain-containing [Acanthamoeba polyphaga mimivirus]
MNLISDPITKDFFKLFDSEILSDVKITLVDDKKRLSLNLHRVILFIRCKFFEKMFSNFDQQYENIVQVIDVDIAKDIIKLIYGFEFNQPDDWQYSLKYYICCDYFGLDCQLPTDIKVSSDCFDNLLDLIEIIGYSDETIKILADNIPSDYDISTLPIELVKELNNHIYSSDMVVMNCPNKHRNMFDRLIDISIVNKNAKQIEKIQSGTYCQNLYYLSNINKIAFTMGKTLFIYDLNTSKTQEHKWDDFTFESLEYNWVNNELIALVYNSKKETRSIHILCVDTYNIMETICHTISKKIIKKICLSSSCNKLAYVLQKNYSGTWKTKEYIKVYNFETKKHTTIYKSNRHHIRKLKFINNDTSIIFSSDHDSNAKEEIKLYNMLGEGEIIHTVDDINDFDVYLDKYLLIVTSTQFILFDFIEKTVIYKFSIYFDRVKIIPNGKMITYGYSSTTIYDIMQGKSSAQDLDLIDVRDFCLINFKTSLKKRIEDFLAQSKLSK